MDNTFEIYNSQKYEENEETKSQKFQTRKLITKDIFTIVRIVVLAGIKDVLYEIISTEKVEENQELLGILLMSALLQGASRPDLERKIYDFLADIANTKPEEVECLEIAYFTDLLKQISEENNMSNFFKAVRSLLEKTR